MGESPTTRASLLLRLRDARDEEAWRQFVDLYAPLVHAYLRNRGLQDADAADLTQDALRAISGAVGRFDYDPDRGSFRGWLFTIVRNALRNFLNSPRRREQGAGDTGAARRLEEHPAPEESAEWEREHHRHLLAAAARVVRAEVQETTWLAFWKTSVEGQEVKAVAAELGVSVASVYLARSRVMARLKEQVLLLEGDSPCSKN